jgi:hypothetical protein
MHNGALTQLIRNRARAARERELAQGKLFSEDEQFAETIRMKLDGLWESNQMLNFTRCGTEDFFRTCKNCGTVEKFPYRCSIKWCPRCAWRIAAKRKTLIEHFAGKITQPKHLILTAKNFPILTRSRIRRFSMALARLRRLKIFTEVRGGCASLEITNEGNGWHLHAHCLVDVRWLDMEKISQVWGKCVGQNFAIVKIKDVRERDYLKEICKYVVEGSELAKWPPEKILEFVSAVKGRRMFFSFGSLRKMAPQIRAEIFANKEPAAVCNCGCQNFIYRDQLAEEMADLERLARAGHSRISSRAAGAKSHGYDTSGKVEQLNFPSHKPDRNTDDGHFQTHGELRGRRKVSAPEDQSRTNTSDSDRRG